QPGQIANHQVIRRHTFFLGGGAGGDYGTGPVSAGAAFDSEPTPLALVAPTETSTSCGPVTMAKTRCLLSARSTLTLWPTAPASRALPAVVIRPPDVLAWTVTADPRSTTGCASESLSLTDSIDGLMTGRDDGFRLVSTSVSNAAWRTPAATKGR